MAKLATQNSTKNLILNKQQLHIVEDIQNKIYNNHASQNIFTRYQIVTLNMDKLQTLLKNQSVDLQRKISPLFQLNNIVKYTDEKHIIHISTINGIHTKMNPAKFDNPAYPQFSYNLLENNKPNVVYLNIPEARLSPIQSKNNLGTSKKYFMFINRKNKLPQLSFEDWQQLMITFVNMNIQGLTAYMILVAPKIQIQLPLIRTIYFSIN